MTILISLVKDNQVVFDKSGGNPNSEMGWAICWRPFIDFDKFWGNPNNVHWDEQACLSEISSRQGLFIGCQLFGSVTNSNKLGEKWSRHLPSGPRRTVVIQKYHFNLFLCAGTNTNIPRSSWLNFGFNFDWELNIKINIKREFQECQDKRQLDNFDFSTERVFRLKIVMFWN